MGKILTGFWRPGNGGQHWQTGLSIPALKSKDTEMVNNGMRLVDVVIQDGDDTTAVGRPGSGAQFWWSGPHDQFKGVDQGHFDGGLRLVSLAVGYA